MKKTALILILMYFSLGTLLLPLGDFSTLKDLPKMYEHCKHTEHHDMTPIDFITDHLLNFDSIFDKHEDGDDQKPHRQMPIQDHGQFMIDITPAFSLNLKYSHPIEKKPLFAKTRSELSDFKSSIFRPPIV